MKKSLADVRSLARSYTQSAINVLSAVMQQPEAPPSARVTAAIALLDRGWGKPDQTSNVNIRAVVAREIADDQLAAIATGAALELLPAPRDDDEVLELNSEER